MYLDIPTVSLVLDIILRTHLSGGKQEGSRGSRHQDYGVTTPLSRYTQGSAPPQPKITTTTIRWRQQELISGRRKQTRLINGQVISITPKKKPINFCVNYCILHS